MTDAQIIAIMAAILMAHVYTRLTPKEAVGLATTIYYIATRGQEAP